MRVRGFTTMELAVAMVLTGIIISLGYSGYVTYLRQYNTYAANLDETASLRNLQALLTSDFSQGELILKTDEGVEIFKKQEGKVEYMVTGERLLRKQGEWVDTFLLAVQEVKTGFMRKEEFISGQPVDLLSLEGVFKKQAVQLTFKHTYSRAELMEFEKQ